MDAGCKRFTGSEKSDAELFYDVIVWREGTRLETTSYMFYIGVKCMHL